MKKIIITALCAIFVLFSTALFAQEKIRVVVEGIEDASGNTAGVHIATPKEAELMKLRAMAAQGDKMEKEIIEALIVKIINLEEEVKKSKRTEALILIILTMAILIMLAAIILLRKR
jgi:hypothetical protein